VRAATSERHTDWSRSSCRHVCTDSLKVHNRCNASFADAIDPGGGVRDISADIAVEPGVSAARANVDVRSRNSVGAPSADDNGSDGLSRLIPIDADHRSPDGLAVAAQSLAAVVRAGVAGSNPGSTVFADPAVPAGDVVPNAGSSVFADPAVPAGDVFPNPGSSVFADPAVPAGAVVPDAAVPNVAASPRSDVAARHVVVPERVGALELAVALAAVVAPSAAVVLDPDAVRPGAAVPNAAVGPVAVHSGVGPVAGLDGLGDDLAGPVVFALSLPGFLRRVVVCPGRRQQ